MDDSSPTTRVALPAGGHGEWRSLDWVSDEAGELTRAALDVTPAEAFRQLRVRRANGELLANESWDQSRTRGVRIWPANRQVAVGETLRLEAVAWWDKSPVDLTAVLHWRKDDRNGGR